jgi:hypothetical protein
MKLKIYQLLILFLPLCLGAGRVVAQETAAVGDTAVALSNNPNQTVNIGYGEQPKWMVSSGISTVTGAELSKSFTTNLSNTFYGRLAGLVVLQNSQEPGADAPSVYGRGTNTYNAGRNLLVMVVFPAGSLAWIVSNEGFLTNNKIISYLKLRASYGIVGNDQIGGTRFAFDQRFPYTAQYYFGSTNTSVFGLEEGTAANKNVTWEKEKKLNFGLELTLLKRFDINFDVFNQDRYDILAKPNSTVPQYVGVNLPDLNQGKVNTKPVFYALISILNLSNATAVCRLSPNHCQLTMIFQTSNAIH